MIIKLGFIRDGHIVGTKFYGSHEVAMVPIFSASMLQRLDAAMKGGGPKNLVVFSPKTLQKSQDELIKWIPEGIADYMQTVPVTNNPFANLERTDGGLLIPSQMGMRVTPGKKG